MIGSPGRLGGTFLHAATRARIARFVRFCMVGGVGFCIDAAVLMICTRILGWDPVSGRFASFAVAVLATFELNRSWAFRQAGRGRSFAAFGAYIGVQGMGFLCNLAVYTILYLSLPRPLNAPLFCLALASAAALIVNYAGARTMVFRDATNETP